ncbi:hypothetical protein SORBI_3007G129401 [Sorghum bicolor]|uniref:Uncharacterized protein n=1 Tax=Sorghum bicolor TaxID=4558 RepID=A0A1Z5RAN8_SORBI|nr:hypothetical protein SORBI_3007G129401 [Sorghum bicolor]
MSQSRHLSPLFSLKSASDNGGGGRSCDGGGSRSGGGGGCKQTSSWMRLGPNTESSLFQQRHGSALRRPRKQLVPNTHPFAWYDSSSIPSRWRQFFINPWQMRLPSWIWLHQSKFFLVWASIKLGSRMNA